MNENEFDINGVSFVSVEYKGNDCGFDGGRSCAFSGIRCYDLGVKCTPDKRKDGRNVIFLEVQDERTQR